MLLLLKYHTALIKKNLVPPLTLLQPLNAHPCCSTYGMVLLYLYPAAPPKCSALLTALLLYL